MNILLRKRIPTPEGVTHMPVVSTDRSSDDVSESARFGGRRAAAIVLLLFGFMILNYADKVVVGITGIPIISDLGISREQFGVVQSSFYWLFAPGAIIGGLLLARIPVRWLLAGVALLWVASLAPLMGSVTFGVLLVCRIMLGFAEGPATAMATTVTHSWFAPSKRALPTSIVIAGAGVGPVIASPVLTWLMLDYSWHAPYIALVAVGVFWAILWICIGSLGPMAHQHNPGLDIAGALPATVPYRRLLTTGTVIGLLVLFFTTYWSIAIKVSWMPLYLREGLGYSAESTGYLVALPYAAAAVFQIATGALSGWWTSRGATSRTARCLLASGLAAVGGLSTILFAVMDRGPLQMLVIVAGASMASAGYGVAFTAVSDVVPARQRGVVMSVIVAVYSIGGLAAPLVLGRIVDAAPDVAAGYSVGFVVVGVILLIGAAISALMMNPERDTAKLRAAAENHPH